MNTTKVVPQAPKYSPLGNLPERKIRAGGIVATVWLNKGQKATGEETEYRTISLERSYKDKEGQWQSTNSFRLSDLPKAAVVLQKTYESLILNEQQPMVGAGILGTRITGTGLTGAGITRGAY